MRLEYVFSRLHIADKDQSVSSQNSTLHAFLDLIDLVTRGDTTSEVIKELERVAENLRILQDNPSVDAQRLSDILDNVDNLIRRLNQQGNRHYQPTVDNDLLSTLKRRHHVTCGNVEFDQPALRHWFAKPEQERFEQLLFWREPFETLRLAVKLLLQLIREAAQPITPVAEAGFYQLTLEADQPVQLIRVAPSDPACYPIISAGRHRLSVRFMHQHGNEAPSQVDTPLSFRLCCCSL